MSIPWTDRIRDWNALLAQPDETCSKSGKCSRNYDAYWNRRYGCAAGPSISTGKQPFSVGHCPFGDPGTNWSPQCSGKFDASYFCGLKSKKVSKGAPAFGMEVEFDCSDEVDQCNNVRLQLTDDGTLQLLSRPGTSRQKTLWEWSSGQKKGIPVPGWVSCGLPYLNAGESMRVGQWLSSPSGICRLVVGASEVIDEVTYATGATEHSAAGQKTISRDTGSFHTFLQLQWRESNCSIPSDKDVGEWDRDREDGRAGGNPGTDAVALYQIPQLPPTQWDSATRASYVVGAKRGSCPQGTVVSGSQQAYDTSAYELGTAYAKVAGYDTAGNDIPGAAASGVSLKGCEAICNQYGGQAQEGQPKKEGECAGFVYNKAAKGCFPKDANMFPKGLRVANEDSDIYLRKINPKTSDACPKTVKTESVYQMQSFPASGTVDVGMKCDLAGATECEYEPVEAAAAALRSKRDAMLEKIRSLSETDSRLVAELGYNVDRLTSDIHDYDAIVTKSNVLSGTGLEGPKAHQEDTDLRMLSENHKYLLWTIAAVAVVGVGVKIGS